MGIRVCARLGWVGIGVGVSVGVCVYVCVRACVRACMCVWYMMWKHHAEAFAQPRDTTAAQ